MSLLHQPSLTNTHTAYNNAVSAASKEERQPRHLERINGYRRKLFGGGI